MATKRAKKKAATSKQRREEAIALAKAKLSELASSGTQKAKDAAKFVYDNREKITDAVELIVMVLGAASAIVGKPEKPKRRKKRARASGS